MKTMKKYIKFSLLLSLVLSSTLTSCSDYFDTESTHYIDGEKNHLVTATDTIYSVIGILNKLQAIGDRTILLGEMRGDLVTVNDHTSSDLRDVALFQIGDDNIYNQPRDYYAIINNCNYYIAKADTTKKNNRNEVLFLREFAAVKAIRAWTYLQLVTTYGKVPFVTEPIMSELDADLSRYPMYDIQQVCDYFIHDDNLQALVDVDAPGYGTIRSLPSQIFYFPIDIVLGDLYLWGARTKQDYFQAAKHYHDYIVNRNGKNTSYPTTLTDAYWINDEWKTDYVVSNGYLTMITEEAKNAETELITMIPGDSLPSEGAYSQLRNIFNSRSENNYQVSAQPSQALFDLSDSQDYWYYAGVGTYFKAPKNISQHCDGDLRLPATYFYSTSASLGTNLSSVGHQKLDYYQQIYKHQTRNIQIYRRAQIYLRLAEAANRAGYPAYAYHILSTGMDGNVLKQNVCPLYLADSALLVNNLNFPTDKYGIYNPYATSDRKEKCKDSRMNTQGIHMRGCGYTMFDSLYVLPVNPEITDSLQQIAWQQDKVEEMIVDEMALELCFEGSRFYDLVRIALHRDDPAFVEKKVKARNGEGNDSGISANLQDKRNWFLHWKDQIGY